MYRIMCIIHEDQTNGKCRGLDGSALVHMLMSHKCKTFHDYAGKAFLPYMLEKLESVGRLDIIWNLYLPQSLKQATGQKRGSSCRVSVKEFTATPSNFGTFLKLNKMKPNFPIFSPKILVLLQQKGNSYTLHLKTIVSTPPTSTMSMI